MVLPELYNRHAKTACTIPALISEYCQNDEALSVHPEIFFSYCPSKHCGHTRDTGQVQKDFYRFPPATD